MKTCDVKNIIKSVIDVLFPPRCMICGVFIHQREPMPFCKMCSSGISRIHSPLCTSCRVPFNDSEGEDRLCGEFISSAHNFSLARSFGKYEQSLLEAIHLFKYRGKIALGEVLGKLMAEHTYGALVIGGYDLIMPIPLHPRRLKERGFNQSLILAREIARAYSIPFDFTTLRRNSYTKPQTTLKRKEREVNVKGAFEVTGTDDILEKAILLVDDVYTTGSTAKECARMLLRDGAGEVAVLTLARASQ